MCSKHATFHFGSYLGGRDGCHGIVYYFPHPVVDPVSGHLRCRHKLARFPLQFTSSLAINFDLFPHGKRDGTVHAGAVLCAWLGRRS